MPHKNMIGDAVGKRHQVDVMRPSASLDRYGQRTGSDTTVLEGWPVEIQQLQALELVRAQRIYAEARHSVRGTAYPGHGIDSECYLLWGTRRLHIGAVVDPDGTGYELTLLCGEEM